ETLAALLSRRHSSGISRQNACRRQRQRASRRSNALPIGQKGNRTIPKTKRGLARDIPDMIEVKEGERTMQISEPAEYAILGLLAEQPMHGYELFQRFQSEVLGQIVHIEMSQLYAFLKKLERLALVEAD